MVNVQNNLLIVKYKLLWFATVMFRYSFVLPVNGGRLQCKSDGTKEI